MNGGEGVRLYGLRSTEATFAVVPSRDAASERARRAFVSASYWDLGARLTKLARDEGDKDVEAQLVAVGGQRLATGKDFDAKGGLTKKDALLLSEKDARSLAAGLENASTKVTSIEQRDSGWVVVTSGKRVLAITP